MKTVPRTFKTENICFCDFHSFSIFSVSEILLTIESNDREIKNENLNTDKEYLSNMASKFLRHLWRIQ